MYRHEKVQHESSGGTPQAAKTLVCRPRCRNGRSHSALDRVFPIGGGKENEEITRIAGPEAATNSNRTLTLHSCCGGSMAELQSITTPAVKEIPKTSSIAALRWRKKEGAETLGISAPSQSGACVVGQMPS